jgi:hypothetical protein
MLVGRQCVRQLGGRRAHLQDIRGAIAEGNPQTYREQNRKNEDPENRLGLAQEKPKANHRQLIETAELELTHRANSFL